MGTEIPHVLNSVLAYLAAHDLIAVVAVSFLESIGLPVPALPVLLVAGSLAGQHHQPVLPLVAGSAAAVWVADVAWYGFGWWQGRRVLGLLCGLSLNPDACVGRAERRFRRRPAATLAVAKFIPGLSLMMPPLAGILRMTPWRFLAIDAAAAVGWAAAGVMAGMLFGVRVLPHVMRAQRALTILAAAAVAGFIAWKLFERWWLVRRYAIARIDVDELQRRLASPDGDVFVVDLRSEQAFSQATHMVSGARRIPPGDFERHIDILPLDKEIILYCT
jgi:membrane protein DedA with SNARE-associated domain